MMEATCGGGRRPETARAIPADRPGLGRRRAAAAGPAQRPRGNGAPGDGGW